MSFPRLLLALLYGLSVLSARADEPARLLVPETRKEGIAGLSWITKFPEVELEKGATDGTRAFVRLEGVYSRQNSVLLWGEKVATRTDERGSQSFVLEVPLTGDLTSVRLFAVDLVGNVENEEAIVSVPDLQARLARSRTVEPSRYQVSVAVGYSVCSYRETLVPDFSQTALTAKASLGYVLAPPRWDLGISGYFTALPLTANRADASLRFLGVNLRAGYALPAVAEPWRLAIMAGLYYTTTFVTGDAFGFQNMAGPQIFPVLRRSVDSRNSVSAYFKYSPILSGVVPSFSSSEIASGASWSRLLSGGGNVSVSIDVARLGINIGGVLDIVSNSATIGTAYGW